MTSTQKTKIETFRGPIFAEKSKRDGDYQAIRRRGPVYLLLASLALSAPLAAVSISLSNAVVAQERMRASDLVGTWKGTDGREYTIESSLQRQVSLRIKGPERNGKSKKLPSSPLTFSITGAETVNNLTYSGKFDSAGFMVRALLDLKENFPQKISKKGKIFRRLSEKYKEIYSYVKIKFVRNDEITIERSISNITFAVDGSRTEMDPFHSVETVVLTRDGADPKSPTDSANLDTQDAKRVADSEKDQVKEPDMFFCYRDDKFVKVTEDTPCARSARQWLDDYDNGIGALRNLLAAVPDLSSEAAKTSQAELKRYRKEKTELLEAIKREAEVAQEANEEANPPAAARPLDQILEGVTHQGSANSSNENQSRKGSVELSGGFRLTHRVNGSRVYEELTNSAGVIVQSKIIDRGTQKLLQLHFSDRFHSDGQVARMMTHGFSSSGVVRSEMTTFAPNGDFLHRATIDSISGEWSLNKWNPKTRKFEPRNSKRERPQDIPKFAWDPALMKWVRK